MIVKRKFLFFFLLDFNDTIVVLFVRWRSRNVIDLHRKQIFIIFLRRSSLIIDEHRWIENEKTSNSKTLFNANDRHDKRRRNENEWMTSILVCYWLLRRDQLNLTTLMSLVNGIELNWFCSIIFSFLRSSLRKKGQITDDEIMKT